MLRLEPMHGPLFLSLLASGFAVAFLHGALPNHWLPFVLVGRRQGWSGRKTLAITAAAGVGHALITMVLGLAVVGAGLAVGERLAPVLPYVAGAILMALGLFYLARSSRGGGHLHVPFLGRLAPAQGMLADVEAPALSDRTAILGLMALLALSPCEAFLPVYLSGLRFGWTGFAGLSLALTLAAAGSMTALAGLSLAGAKWLGLKSAERYEGALLGAGLVALGLMVILFEH
jgi:nickel/cobalt exporter